MQAYSLPIRQQWGCGYELPAPAGVPVAPWYGLGYKGDPPTVCPGYTTSLPETIEAARAWRWWSKGQIAAFVDGGTVSDPLKIAVEVFDGAVNSLERWLVTPADKGGGGQ